MDTLRVLKRYFPLLVIFFVAIASCEKPNNPPVADFTFSPATGNTDTVFTFDASSSQDKDDDLSTLQVHWDWSNDGIWDTDYSSNKTMSHQFSELNEYTVVLEVKDSKGMVSSIAKKVSVTPSPPIILTIGIESINYQSVRVFGELLKDGGSPIIDFGACWSTQINPFEFVCITRSYLSQGKFFVYINGLTPNSQYLVRPYGSNTNGTGYGELVSITTPKAETVFNSKLNYGTVDDFEGNVYKTIEIGSHLWMAENLKVTHYRNGDPIAQINDNVEWSNLQTGAYDIYNHDPLNEQIYSKLYNFYCVSDPRSICPTGWHIPTLEEWDVLIGYLIMNQGNKIREIGTTHWLTSNNLATNESGFTALPGGMRYSDGTFHRIFDLASFWSSTEYNMTTSFYCETNSSYNQINRSRDLKTFGLSVRCLKD